MLLCFFLKTLFPSSHRVPSSETQGQIVGARESLNGRKNMAGRKVKNGEKSPWEQCLTRPVPNGHSRSGYWLVPENFCVFLPNQKPEWRWPLGTGLVRHCPQGLFSPFSTFLPAIFSPPFRLSLAPTICPWVSEDGVDAKMITVLKKSIQINPFCHPNSISCTVQYLYDSSDNLVYWSDSLISVWRTSGSKYQHIQSFLLYKISTNS